MYKKLCLILIGSISLFGYNDSDVEYLLQNLGGVSFIGNYYFPKLNLSGRDLSGIEIPVRSNFSFANMQGVNISKSSLKKSNFFMADFSPLEIEVPKPVEPMKKKPLKVRELIEAYKVEDGSEVIEDWILSDPSKEQYVSKSKIELKISNLSYANFSGSNFKLADFEDANLEGAKFNKANLTDVNLKNVIVNEETDFRGASGLSPKQVEYLKSAGAMVD